MPRKIACRYGKNGYFGICGCAECSPVRPPAVKVQPWDIVRLHNRTDRYRVYTYGATQIFCGMNSDTVTDASRDTPVEIIERQA